MDGSRNQREPVEAPKETSEETYNKLLINGLRQDFGSLLEIRRMPLSEYNLMVKAAILKKADKEEELVNLAFYIRNAAAVDRRGRFIYETPRDIFKIEHWEDKIFLNKKDGKEEVFERLKRRALRLRDRR